MDPLAPPLRALIALFSQDLEQQRFGDLSAAGLRQAAEQVESAAEALILAEASASAARAALADAEERLHQQAQRALAYARVFAEDAPDLAARLDDITLPRLRRPSVVEHAAAVAIEPRRRGRPRKLEAHGPTLLEVAPTGS